MVNVIEGTVVNVFGFYLDINFGGLWYKFNVIEKIECDHKLQIFSFKR
jgi:hypothetical protein